MAKYLELRRHTDNDGDVLSDDGVQAALEIGAGLGTSYHLGVSTGAQRATQTLACFLAALEVRLPRGVIVELTLRSDNEDRWREIAGQAEGSSLTAFTDVDADFVETEAERLAGGLHSVFDRLDDEERALVVGHSPSNEAAVYGLTGETIASQSKGDGVLLVQMGEDYRLEQLT